MGRKKTKKIKCNKGGVRLETIFPRNNRSAVEYAEYLNGRRLPPPYQRYRFREMTNIDTPERYIVKMNRFAANRVKDSPNDDQFSPPPKQATLPSRRRRNKTKSATGLHKKKSKRSSMKLANTGSYKRRRNSAPVSKKMSSAKAKDYIRLLKHRKKSLR